MRTYTVQGIVLKRRNIGEADRILTVFTRETGKIQVKAKGVRKITSKRSSHVEPLTLAVLTLYKTASLPLLVEATASTYFSDLKNNLMRIGFAYHVCELVDALCPENQENETIFTLLEAMLQRLSEDAGIQTAIHDFEINLLQQLGYYSEGTHDLAGAKASYFIETILERRLKARQLLPRLS